jgi:hypothetical protein
MFPQIEYKEKEVVVCFNGNALQYLQSIYRDPSQEQHTRMRAAAMAIAFESPKLAVLATVGKEDFGAILDRAVERSKRVMVDVKPIEPKPAPPQPIVEERWLPTVPDLRRFRRRF